MEITFDNYLKQLTDNYIHLPKEPKIAIFIMGIPGSGKTTLIKRFINQVLGKILYRVCLTSSRDEIEFKKENFIECNPDRIGEYFKDIIEEEDLMKETNKMNCKLMKHILSDDTPFYNFTYDSTGKLYGHYLKYIKEAKKINYLTILIDVQSNLLNCYERILLRPRKVEQEIVMRLFEEIYTPKQENHKKYPNLNNYDIIEKETDISLVIDNNNLNTTFIKFISSNMFKHFPELYDDILIFKNFKIY